MNKQLILEFCHKGALVGAKTYTCKHESEILKILNEITVNKQDREILGQENGQTSPERIWAFPQLPETWKTLFQNNCSKEGFQLIDENLNQYLHGIDLGIAFAQGGVSASGTCLVASDSEDVRLTTMISEICVLILNPQNVYGSLPELASLITELQKDLKATYTALITGPSRTLDIERVLTIGVHGPLELHIILLEA